MFILLLSSTAYSQIFIHTRGVWCKQSQMPYLRTQWQWPMAMNKIALIVYHPTFSLSSFQIMFMVKVARLDLLWTVGWFLTYTYSVISYSYVPKKKHLWRCCTEKQLQKWDQNYFTKCSLVFVETFIYMKGSANLLNTSSLYRRTLPPLSSAYVRTANIGEDFNHPIFVLIPAPPVSKRWSKWTAILLSYEQNFLKNIEMTQKPVSIFQEKVMRRHRYRKSYFT